MSEVPLSYQDFPNICRLCLQRADDLQIFTNLKIINLYKLLTNIVVKEEDAFPKNICRNCKNCLHGVNLFIEEWKNNEKRLKKIPIPEEKVVEIYDFDNDMVTRGFGESDLFNTNVIVVEGEDVYSLNDGLNLTDVSLGEPTSKVQKCPIDGEQIRPPEHEQKHCKLSSKCIPDLKCPECEKSFNLKSKLEVHMRSHETIYTCPECERTFTSVDDLSDHARVHTGMPYICEICGNGYLDKTKLEYHLNWHNGTKSNHYLCEYCGKLCKQLASHTARQKTNGIPCAGLKPYSCHVCSLPCATPSHLKVHMTSHTGEKPYACDVCGKTYVYTYSLKVHKRSHTSEPPHVCSICPKGFYSVGALNKHFKRHKEN